jgi:hypothetical protein
VDGVSHGGEPGDDLRATIGRVFDARRKLSIEKRLLASIFTVTVVVALSALLSALTNGWPIRQGARSGLYETQWWWVIVLLLSVPVGATLTAQLFRAISSALRSVSIGATGSAFWRLGRLLSATTAGRFVAALSGLLVASLLHRIGAK